MWGAKEEWNYYMQKKAPVVIQQEFDAKGKYQWSVDVKETLMDEQGPMTLDVQVDLEDAIAFCQENQLSYQVVSSTQ